MKYFKLFDMKELAPRLALKTRLTVGDSDMTQSTPDAAYAPTNVSNILSG